ncbi:SulP family inorganic anion transporter [Cupriavidus pinatubonensis]|uniref:SulP family inorganic anion transporter n=1 Tax=Cupriavidus pinatubonensis TaxID=248026 RepID=UPI00112E08BB|nr:SulP family inorganic anion transporter [Cupriavidus pinatubonensis]QYY32862.1 SulP family inorganic anion transporter [Cupriavidus pinatubonensis]TPQ38522.1 sulfate transporter [Cupriavidus pinatubonensis]
MTVSATSPGTRLQRLLPWTQRVSRATLRADGIAGLLGAVLVLPQGVAFATLAGLPPEYGIYTAVVPCIVAALFGSSWHVMSGPTNANSLALFAMLSPVAFAGSPAYIGLALSVTILVGLMQLAVGTLRLGTLANFISPSVLLGFTCGAATLIGLYALKDLFGLAVPTGTSAFGVLRFLSDNVDAINWGAATVGAVTLGATLLFKRLGKRLPFMLLGLMAGYGVALLLNRTGWGGGHHVNVVGPIPSAIPAFHVPDISWRSVPDLLGIASALTIVALGQSISIAKAVALRSGQHIDANREFIGQGLSNIAGGLFSGYISCGSLNRSVPNFEAGAKTPLASVFSALWLLALVAVSASLLAQIPLAAIAAMLLLVAWGLFDFARLRRIAALSRTEFAIAVGTFAATLMIRLEMAVLLGTILSLVAYLYRTSRPAVRSLVPDADDPGRRFTPLDELHRPQPECPQLKLLRMEGAIYFGAVQYVTDRLHWLRTVNASQKHLLAMTKSMNFIDLAGAEMWEAELSERRAAGGDLYFHRPRTQVLQTWEQTGFTGKLGPDHVFSTKRQALHTIIGQLSPDVCAQCKVRIFEECAQRPGAQTHAETL